MSSSADLRPYLDELERFADGEMLPAEQADFEARLEVDDTLHRAYETYQQLTADLRWVAGHETLRLRLQALDKRLDEREAALLRMRRDTRRKQVRWGTVALISGLVLSALVLAYLLLRPTAPAAAPATADLWARYYAPEPGIPPTAAILARRPLLAEAMREYRAAQYPAALRALRRASPDRIGQDTLLYFNGVFLLRQHQPDAARPYLQRVSEQPGSRLAERALYHLGMAAWQAEQPAEARRVLTRVATDSLNPYYQDARRTLADGVVK